jgi:ectoine hydroxylase-related dioxygenase (phytanoyl-CoA dioxygenase family)
MYVPSSLWVDQPDFLDRMQARRDQFTGQEEECLTSFAQHGYCTFELQTNREPLDDIHHSVERFWREKPRDLAYACQSPPRRMAQAQEASERRPGCRIHDMHSHCPAALNLYLHPQIFRLVELILGGPAVAIQSLYFEHGSQQALHRDQVVVPVDGHGHLIAAWIALEDISPDSGPLVYVPGSHRLPYFELAPGEYRYDAARVSAARVEEGLRWEDAQYRSRGLEKTTFTPRKGEVLLWHASLSHGGTPVRNDTLTRKSFVVHYSARSTYRQRGITIVESTQEGDVPRVYSTRETLEQGGREGFENPLRGAAA